MKTICLIILVFIGSVRLLAQNLDEVVYLKNGSIVRGVILEQVPNESLKIQTKDGNLFVFKFSEVDKITKEPSRETPASITKQKPQPRISQEAVAVSKPEPETQDNETIKMPLSYGIKVGVSFANMVNKDKTNDYSEHSKLFPGLFLGGYLKYNYTENLSFEGGLLYVQKGQKIEESGKDGSDTWTEMMKVRLTYLEIPLHIRYAKNVGGKKLYGIIGPYVGMGMGGKYSYEDTYTYDGETEVETDTEPIIWGNTDNADFKKLDFGLSIGAGMELGKINIGLEYGLGLANIYSVPSDGDISKNKVLRIGLTYMFK